MTKRQYKRAVALIKKDCQIRGEYTDFNGNTCAIGCLALAAGVKKSTLLRSGTNPIEWLPGIARRIKSRFGLSMDEQADIQQENDSCHVLKNRRRGVLKLLKSLMP